MIDETEIFQSLYSEGVSQSLDALRRALSATIDKSHLAMPRDPRDTLRLQESFSPGAEDGSAPARFEAAKKLNSLLKEHLRNMKLKWSSRVLSGVADKQQAAELSTSATALVHSRVMRAAMTAGNYSNPSSSSPSLVARRSM